MAKGERLLTPAEFAEALGVDRSVVQARLDGSQKDYWRQLLGVVHGGRGRRGRLLIPAASVETWRQAGSRPASRKRPGKLRRSAPQGREVAGGDARPGVNEVLMGLSRRAETVERLSSIESSVLDLVTLRT